MNIAVNTRLLLPHRLEGIGWFTQQIFSRLPLWHPEVNWFYIFDRPPHADLRLPQNVKTIHLPPPTRHPLLWQLWFHHLLPPLLKRLKANLFVSPDGYLALSASCAQLNVIHDINFEHHPENIPAHARGYFKKYFPRYAREATRLATVSHYSRGDIARTYQIDPLRIDVVPNGVGDFFHPLPLEEQAAFRQKHSDGQPYFVFIGAFNPRKNMEGMLQAYQQYRDQGGQARFMFIGDKMYWTTALQQQVEQHPYHRDLLFPGRLSGAALNAALASAQALLFVSHFEGFGIPIIEAFQCGVPVITSTTTSMPEVAGDAALLCPPKEPAKIAEAMHTVQQPDVARELIQAGTRRVQHFSWDASAEAMWQAIQNTLADG